jgi:hypothetical protein
VAAADARRQTGGWWLLRRGGEEGVSTACSGLRRGRGQRIATVFAGGRIAVAALAGVRGQAGITARRAVSVGDCCGVCIVRGVVYGDGRIAAAALAAWFAEVFGSAARFAGGRAGGGGGGLQY